MQKVYKATYVVAQSATDDITEISLGGEPIKENSEAGLGGQIGSTGSMTPERFLISSPPLKKFGASSRLEIEDLANMFDEHGIFSGSKRQKKENDKFFSKLTAEPLDLKFKFEQS